nr:hypothetical protein [Tanacetum cinerariifolium]
MEVAMVMTMAAAAMVVWQHGDDYGGGVRATRKGRGGDRRGGRRDLICCCYGLATLNLDFAPTEGTPKLLDFAAFGVLNKALFTLEALDNA